MIFLLTFIIFSVNVIVVSTYQFECSSLNSHQVCKPSNIRPSVHPHYVADNSARERNKNCETKKNEYLNFNVKVLIRYAKVFQILNRTTLPHGPPAQCSYSSHQAPPASPLSVVSPLAGPHPLSYRRSAKKFRNFVDCLPSACSWIESRATKVEKTVHSSKMEAQARRNNTSCTMGNSRMFRGIQRWWFRFPRPPGEHRKSKYMNAYYDCSVRWLLRPISQC